MAASFSNQKNLNISASLTMVLLFIFFASFPIKKIYSQSVPILLGMTSEGGDGVGVIFGMPTGTTSFSQQNNLNRIAPGKNPRYTNLLQASNGKLYGMTEYGGANDMGVLFEYDIITNAYTKKVDFISIINGSHPMGSLIEASNGKLYGMTESGGANDKGVLFEYDITTNTCIIKLDFNGIANGQNPFGSLIQASNGKLYGMTGYGGSSGGGVLFEYDITTNIYTKKLDFNGVANGKYPKGSLMQAANGKLYGMTQSGGANDKGVLFEYDITTDAYTKKFDFNGTDGRNPYGSLIQATNGKLYGMTRVSSIGLGLLFEYDINTSTYISKIIFNGTAKGSYPYGSLVQGTNGKLYGITQYGGANDKGVLFEYDITTDTYIKKFDFGVNGAYGKYPVSSLIQGANGNLYGMTQFGGFDDSGILFEYDITTSTYIQKVGFNGTANGNKPKGALIQANNGKLYGTTSNGGNSDCGLLFEYDIMTNTYTKKLDFYTSGLFQGRVPSGSLIQATNGKLYGMTRSGGSNGAGILFEYNIVTNSYSSAFVFVGTANGTSGSNPQGSLMQATNGKLYGMTYQGGTNDKGVLFEYDIITDIYTKKLDFNGTNGSYPTGSLLQATNGKLYGMTSDGGNSAGVLFEYDITTNTYTKKIDFNSTNGGFPYGSLIQAINGKLYGMTSYYGTNNKGTLFEYDITTNTYIKKFDFNGTSGSNPFGSLIQATNGKLYGTTSLGGANDMGVVFEYDITTNTYTKKLDFNSINGKNPNGYLMELLMPCLASITNQTNVSCNGGSDGSATITMTGGTGTFIYSWAPTGGTGSTASALTDGVYTCTITDTAGCLTTKTVTVTEPIPLTVSSSATSILCNNGTAAITITGNGGMAPYAGEGVFNVNAGTYTYIVTDTNGCSANTTIIITEPIAITYSQAFTLCDGDSVTVGNNIYTSSAIYTDIFNSLVNGCDSIVTTNLTVLPANTFTQSPSVCSGDSLTVGNHIYTSSATYTDIFNSLINGCDSIVTTNLTVLPANTFTQSPSVCSGDSLIVGIHTYTADGNYIDTLYSYQGCDSTVTTNLTINTIDTSISNSNGILTSNASSATYQWIDCNNGNAPILGETSQSYIATTNGAYAVIVTQNSCLDTSACQLVISTSVSENELNNAITIYPNPYSGATQITYTLTKKSEVNVEVYNTIGQKVETLVNTNQAAGEYRYTFSAKEKGFDAGVYFVKVTVNGKATMKRIVEMQ